MTAITLRGNTFHTAGEFPAPRAPRARLHADGHRLQGAEPRRVRGQEGDPQHLLERGHERLPDLRAAFLRRGGDLERLLFRSRMRASASSSVDSGISAAEVTLVEGSVRFSSVQEFVRIEVKGSPLADMVSDEAMEALAAESESALAEFVLPSGEIELPMDAHIVTASKPA